MIAGITYPDDEQVLYFYDGGLLSQVGTYATFSNYKALGQVQTIDFGNGAKTNLTYYKDTHQRLKSIKTTGRDGETHQGVVYDVYDDAGNIKSIKDNVIPDQTLAFALKSKPANRFAAVTADSTAYWDDGEINLGCYPNGSFMTYPPSAPTRSSPAIPPGQKMRAGLLSATTRTGT